MTAHDCTTFDPSCYRCDLSRDETSPYGPTSGPSPLAPVLNICQCAGCLYGEPYAGHCFTSKGKLRHWCAATKRAGLLPAPPQNDQQHRRFGDEHPDAYCVVCHRSWPCPSSDLEVTDA